MNSSFGKNLKISIWGGSHEPEIGVKIEGIPVGTEIDMIELRKFMKRRAPGNNPFATKRREADEPVPVSGLAPKCGSPGQNAADQDTTGNGSRPNVVNHGVAGDGSRPDVVNHGVAGDGSRPDVVNHGVAGDGSRPDVVNHGVAGDDPEPDVVNKWDDPGQNAADQDTTGYDTAWKVPQPAAHNDPAASTYVGNAIPEGAAGTAGTDMPASGISQTPDRLVTTDSVISFKIINKDRRSSDYGKLRNVPRPGHADYTARLRYGESLNMAGGGPFSARMTAPLCIAGGIALQILARQGILIGGHIFSIGNVRDDSFSPVNIDPKLILKLRGESMPVISSAARVSMETRMCDTRDRLDSLGGIIEVCALGLPAGIGGAMYSGIESVLAPILFGIPAVKGVEFGAGFDAARLTGSVNNDAFYYDDDGNVKTRTNHHGGILGGITTGMPLIARVALKPTPSIGLEQDSIDLEKKENTKLTVTGRHDPCVAVRAVPIVEAAVALGLLDCIYDGGTK